MSVKQLHIELGQRIQSFENFANKNIYDGQKDMAINIAIRNLTRDIIKNNIQNDNKEFNEIQSLIEYDKKLKVFHNGRDFYSILPQDCIYFLSSKSLISKTTVELSSVILYKTLIPIKESDETSIYSDFDFSIDGKEILKSSSWNNRPLDSKEEIYLIIDYIIEQCSRFGIEIYWEKYNDTFVKDNFILITNTIPVVSLFYNTSNIVSTTTSFTVKKTNITDSSLLNEQENRLVKHTNSINYRTHPFHKTKFYSPVTKVSGNKITIISDDCFIVNDILATYIRKPNLVSLILNKDNELSQLKDEIISQAAEIIELDTKNENFINRFKINQENE